MRNRDQAAVGKRLIVMAFVAVGAVACQTDREADEGPRPEQERDSAGIRIIENGRPEEGSRLPWRIGPEPSVTIGSVEADDEFQLYRVDDALRLGDGRLVVANGSSHQLLVFDEDGNYLAAWGQKGDGPGDFGGGWGGNAYGFRLFWMEQWPGDSIAVCHGTYSLGLELLSIFDSSGRHGRRVNLARDGSHTVCRDVMPDGAILASRSPGWSGYPPTGMDRPEMDFLLLEPDGSLRAELGSHPGAEEFQYNDEVGSPPFNFWMHDPPFQQSIVWGAWDGLAIVSNTDRYEIKAYAADGSLARIVRRDHHVRTPTEADLEWFKADRLDGITDDDFRQKVTQVLDALPLPSSFPAFSPIAMYELGIEVDALDYLWVREYRLPGDEGDRPLWTVFDPDGIVQGFIETPPGLVIYEIGEDYVLGKVFDELRVEYVQLWPLDRSGAG